VHTKAHRHTTCAVYQCFRGRGSIIVDGLQIDWEQGDFIALPPWTWHEHVNGSSSEDAILFSTTDSPILQSLNLLAEEPYEENGGHQKVTGTYADRFGYENLNA
jgi:gentisate 1,2-dioxygenase